MPKLAHIPFADEDGNGTPLSFLQAALKEPDIGHNSKTYISVAISMLENGLGLRDVGVDHSQLEDLENRFKMAMHLVSQDQESFSPNELSGLQGRIPCGQHFQSPLEGCEEKLDQPPRHTENIR